MGKRPARLRDPLTSPVLPQETHAIFLCRGDVVAVRYAARADWYRGKGTDGEVEMQNNKISSPQIYLDGPAQTSETTGPCMDFSNTRLAFASLIMICRIMMSLNSF